MSPRTLTWLSLTVSLLAGCARPRPRVQEHADARALVELEHRWVASYVARDTAFLEMLYAPDAVFVNSRGEVGTGAQEIEEVRTGAVIYRRFDTWDVVPRIYGDAAVVTARSRIEGVVTATGREIAVDLRVIDVFVRVGGVWKVVASQGTRVDR